MDEVIFENETLYDFKKYCEAADKYFMLKSSTYIRLALIAIVAISYFGFMLTVSQSLLFSLVVILIVFVVVVVILALRIPQKKTFKQYSYINPTGVSRACFTQDELLLSTDNSNTKLNYSFVTHVGESKNLFVIVLKNSLAILDKESFTKGDFIDFRKFITDKCPDAKIKLKS